MKQETKPECYGTKACKDCYKCNDCEIQMDCKVIFALADQKQKMIQTIYKYFPEKPVRCFAEAMKNGSSQALRRDILKEFEELK